MKSRFFRFGVVASLCAALFGGVASAQAADQEPITLGVLVSLTGTLAAYGTPFSDAVVLAIDEVNAKGGVNGRPIKVILEDTQASNTVALNALNRVLQSKPVAIIGPGLGTQILAMMPVINREHVPMLAGPSTRRVTQTGSKYFFRTTSHDGFTKELVTRFIVDDLHKKSVGIIDVANEWGYSGRDNVTADLETLYKLKPVSVASYQPTDRDFTGQILQMQKDGADVIFTQGHPVDEALIARQLKQLNVEVPHIGSASLCQSLIRQLVTPAEVAGQYCESPGIIPEFDPRPAMQAFVKAYKAKTGFTPGIYETNYYDVAHMLAELLKQTGDDREKLAEALRTASYDGIVGTYHSDEEGNLRHGAVIMQFQADGSVKAVKSLQ